MKCTKCGRLGHLFANCNVDPEAAAREAAAAIRAVAKRYPDGIELADLLAEANVKRDRGEKLVVSLRKAGELVKRQTVGRKTLFTAAEHEAELLAFVERLAKAAKKPQAVGRRWPETSSWTPPQPRIPSVWHLGQMAANEERQAA